MTTVGDLLIDSVAALSKAGVKEARLDARLIIAHALNITPEKVFGYPEKVLETGERDYILSLITRRVEREPLALIIGEKEFWSLRFVISPATLIPRPDSETLIEAVLAAYPDKKANLRILDLGTGSGCLLLTLLHEYENATGIGTDFSSEALAVARLNGRNLDLSLRAGFVLADWNDGIADFGAFDIIISNPPYIPDGEESELQPEVALYEPHSALFAGIDGLQYYRAILSVLSGLANTGCGIFFEVGINQGEAVARMMEKAGMSDITSRSDLAGIKRCVSGKIL
ncbi:MAG: peptide chain release factor N(5)-glutamine methyltransferase [Rhodospirillales bacterium]|nr:peptide chain release factor N(5)-glutamine methyltransferase [Rhodospirillales bacterium]